MAYATEETIEKEEIEQKENMQKEDAPAVENTLDKKKSTPEDILRTGNTQDSSKVDSASLDHSMENKSKLYEQDYNVTKKIITGEGSVDLPSLETSIHESLIPSKLKKEHPDYHNFSLAKTPKWEIAKIEDVQPYYQKINEELSKVSESTVETKPSNFLKEWLLGAAAQARDLYSKPVDPQAQAASPKPTKIAKNKTPKRKAAKKVVPAALTPKKKLSKEKTVKKKVTKKKTKKKVTKKKTKKAAKKPIKKVALKKEKKTKAKVDSQEKPKKIKTPVPLKRKEKAPRNRKNRNPFTYAHQVILENFILSGVFFIGLLVFSLVAGPQFVGYFVAEEGTSTIPLALSWSESNSTAIQLEDIPTEVRLSGTMIGTGNVSVYLETDDFLFLIFDEEYIEDEGTIEITGLVIANVTSESNETNSTSGTNETEEVNQTTSTANNETTNLSVNQTTSTSNNSTNNSTNTSAINQTTSTANNATSNETNTTSATGPVISFTQVCRETCALTNISKNFTIRAVVNNATVNITSLTYSYAITNFTNTPPTLLSNISNISFKTNLNASLDLSTYFNDTDEDGLVYSATPIPNVSVYITGSDVDLVARSGATGTRYVRFLAYDGTNRTFSNNITIDILPADNETIERNETTVQIFAEIGKPVKYVKKIELNDSVNNLTVNVSSKAQNITVRKIENNQSIEINETQVTLRLNETEKILDAFEENEAIDEALGLTAAVVGAPFGDGIFSRLLGSRGISIIGNVIAPPIENLSNVTVNLSVEDSASIVIEENVSSVEVEYYLPAPEAIEVNSSAVDKNITVTSEIHYENILTYTNIVETQEELIDIFWYVNESEYNTYQGLPLLDEYNNSLNLSSEVNIRMNIEDLPELYVSYLDTNENGLIDRVQWVTPHLSNQTFEVDITVLDVQSYPVIGGNWSTRFLTTGTANLSIIGRNLTTFGEETIDNTGSNDDLEFLEITCGNDTIYHHAQTPYNSSVHFILDDNSTVQANVILNQTYIINGILIADYNCSHQSIHTVRVITEGVHNQQFMFGNVTAYANNLAQYAPTFDVIRFSDNNLTASYVFT